MAQAGRHHHHGRMREAAQAYGQAARHAERRVDRDEALYRQAKVLERAGEHARAVAILDEVAARRPVSRRTVRALFDASKLRVELGRRDEGLAGYRQLVRAHPEDGLASRALFLLLADFERRDDADGALAFLEQLDREVGRSTLGDDVLAHRADLLLARGDREGAKRALERIVAEHPYPHGQRWDDALTRLADLAGEDGDWPAAVRYLERMLAVHEWTSAPGSYTLPSFPEARLRVARIHRDHLRDPAAARASFVATYEEFPTSRVRDDAMVELGEMLLDGGDRVEGCGILKDAVEEFEVGSARRRAAARIGRDCQGE